MVTLQRQDEIKLAEHIVKRTLDQLTGQSETICIGDRPRNKYFVGSLANRPEQDDDESADTPDNDLFSRLAPSAVGLDALVLPKNPDAQLIIQPKFTVYYRILPDLVQQRRASGYQTSAIGTAQDQGAGEWAITYRKLEVKIEPIAIPLPKQITGLVPVDCTTIQQAISTSIQDIQQQVNTDPLCFCESTGTRPVLNVNLLDETTYSKFLLEAISQTKVIPQWTIRLQIQARPSNNGCVRLAIMLQNTSPDDSKERSYTDHYIFDVCLRIEGVDAILQPFEFDLLPEDYRYNRQLWGLGRNCGVQKLEGQNVIKTVNAPIYYQPVYTTRDAVEPKLPKAKFIDLAQDPVTTLNDIARAMDSYRVNWEQLQNRRRTNPDWTEEMLNQAQEDLENFVEEISRFQRGIWILDQYPVLNQAFRLMNQTFVQGSKHPSWRLFQIVYIVTQLPAIAAREYNDPNGRADWDFVDVLWFPTGGGKTEAYLGLIVCSAFFDRLRGKRAGVTAWMRFPLRLLSLQQLQRLADILGAAELLRRRTPSINDLQNDPFSVAYLVGSGNTPNRLTEYGEGGWLERLKSRPDLMERFLTIPNCPFCGQTSVVMTLDEQTTRLVHRCTNTNCTESQSGGMLPIFIVDNEIYRYLPTVIAGTIDKVTAVGYERKFSHQIGRAHV